MYSQLAQDKWSQGFGWEKKRHWNNASCLMLYDLNYLLEDTRVKSSL